MKISRHIITYFIHAKVISDEISGIKKDSKYLESFSIVNFNAHIVAYKVYSKYLVLTEVLDEYLVHESHPYASQ